ncbi:MAG: hypothetical protein JJT78_14885 [Leptospira sp.]|nr:hypothetical protein [Leptospira sp.]
METVLVVLTLLYTSYFLEKKHHKESIGATIEYNILSNQVIKEDDVYVFFLHKIDVLKLDEHNKSRNKLWFTIRNGFWYPPGRVVFDNDSGILYLYTEGFEGLYSEFYYDSIQIANYLDRNGISYCISRRGIWTDEMLQSEEMKSLDSKKCKNAKS